MPSLLHLFKEPVYTVTAADDASETTEVTTNEKGVALTKTYDQKWEGKTSRSKRRLLHQAIN